jgi:hypothetical protein
VLRRQKGFKTSKCPQCEGDLTVGVLWWGGCEAGGVRPGVRGWLGGVGVEVSGNIVTVGDDAIPVRYGVGHDVVGRFWAGSGAAGAGFRGCTVSVRAGGCRGGDNDCGTGAVGCI